MALFEEIKSIFGSIVESISDVVSDSVRSFKYGSMIVIVGGLALLGGGSFYGYRWYVVNREQAAQQAFAEYMQDFYLATNNDNVDNWQRVASLFEYGYSKHSGSNLAPYFLAYLSDAQLKQGNRDQAIATMDRVVSSVRGTALAPLFKTKLALMQMDDSQDAIQQKGLNDLVQLAHDKGNQYNDVALFYLGRYYWGIDNLDEAQKAWQELVDNGKFETKSPSPWVREAQSKLKQLAH